MGEEHKNPPYFWWISHLRHLAFALAFRAHPKTFRKSLAKKRKEMGGNEEREGRKEKKKAPFRQQFEFLPMCRDYWNKGQDPRPPLCDPCWNELFILMAKTIAKHKLNWEKVELRFTCKLFNMLLSFPIWGLFELISTSVTIDMSTQQTNASSKVLWAQPELS